MKIFALTSKKSQDSKRAKQEKSESETGHLRLAPSPLRDESSHRKSRRRHLAPTDLQSDGPGAQPLEGPIGRRPLSRRLIALSALCDGHPISSNVPARKPFQPAESSGPRAPASPVVRELSAHPGAGAVAELSVEHSWRARFASDRGDTETRNERPCVRAARACAAY